MKVYELILATLCDNCAKETSRAPVSIAEHMVSLQVAEIVGDMAHNDKTPHLCADCLSTVGQPSG